jgi:NAD(P)H-dependent FMN reductase
MSAAKILAFSGSTRSGSFNQQLVAIAAEAARSAGAEVSLVNLKDYPMPLFSEDIEANEGAPQSARAFKALLMEADGFLIATPEYNSSLTPTLKNAIDWASREAPGEPTLVAFTGKKVGLLSASPSGYGGARSLQQAQQLFGNIDVEVIERHFSLAKAHEAFDAEGELKDADLAAKAKQVGLDLAKSLG